MCLMRFQYAWTFPGFGNSRIEDIKGLRWLNNGVGKGDAATYYLVQVVIHPHQIIVLVELFPQSKCIAGSVVEPGRGPV
jgi:hypothetical protein